ncbi:helix-turn-helix domain-containing protein [Amycolatopsis sp. cmx-4-54]|uniref:helix-turn-helix domain-containing protein n=1 Tax=Amycolatopsis sp. cmx-4-54 TaxID=2790936 RepID=UPI00397E5839
MLLEVVARSGLSQEDFANSVGYPAARFGRVLTGRTRISPDLAHAVAQRYKIDPLDLLIRQNRTALATIAADRDHNAFTTTSAPAVRRQPVCRDVDASAINVVRAVITKTGLSNSRFAVTLGYDPTIISKILNGHQPITPALADSISRRYGIDASDLLARQARWQLAAVAERNTSTRPAAAPPG